MGIGRSFGAGHRFPAFSSGWESAVQDIAAMIRADIQAHV